MNMKFNNNKKIVSITTVAALIVLFALLAICTPIHGIVVDPPSNQPPDVSAADPSIDCIWPPNHKFVDITIVGVTDPDGDEVTITITEITRDEPTTSIEGAGGDVHAPDASGVGTDIASLRAERSGTGNGRVYEVTFVASDGKAETGGSETVCVPHDRKEGTCECIDDGQNYDATEINK